MAKHKSKNKTFSQRCMEVELETILIVSFALAASFLINVHMLTAPTATQAVMFP